MFKASRLGVVGNGKLSILIKLKIRHYWYVIKLCIKNILTCSINFSLLISRFKSLNVSLNINHCIIV